MALVGRLVVEHDVDVEVLRDGLVDEVQKLPELLGPDAAGQICYDVPDAISSGAWFVVPLRRLESIG